jgi:hypothetical protein
MCGCRCLGRDLGVVAEVLLSCCDCSPGAQLAEALDVGVDKMDWLETSWSQALLLIHMWSSHKTRHTGGYGAVHEAKWSKQEAWSHT